MSLPDDWGWGCALPGNDCGEVIESITAECYRLPTHLGVDFIGLSKFALASLPPFLFIFFERFNSNSFFDWRLGQWLCSDRPAFYNPCFV